MSATSQWLFGPFRLDPTNACLWRGERMIVLRPKVFAVLAYLVTHAGQLVTKEALLEAVWAGTIVSDAVLKACMGELRKALGETAKAPQFIATLHRHGYRFIAPVTTIDQVPAPSADLRPPQRSPDCTSHLDLLLYITQPSPLNPAPFVGRDHALGSLHTRLQQARAGIRQVVFVAGEAGIGKTALIEVFLAQTAADPYLWIAHGQCIEHYGPGEAYLPVLETLGRLCREPDRAHLVALLRQHAPTWLVQMPWLLHTTDRSQLQHELLGSTRERMLRELPEALQIYRKPKRC